jgi:hypothetical protein
MMMLLRLVGCALLLASWASAAEAAWQGAAPAYPPPPVPSCAEVMAHYPGQPIWVGEYAGRYRTAGLSSAPYGAVGCFLSEAECRQWLHQNMSFAGEPMLVMACRLRR